MSDPSRFDPDDRARVAGHEGFVVVVVALAVITAGCDGSAVLGLPPQASPPPNVVRLVPTKQVYGLRELVEAKLLIERATDVGSVAFILEYDPEVLRYAGGMEGSFMNRDGTTTVFLSGPAGDEGAIQVAVARLGGGAGVAGSGLLGTIVFVSVGPGTSDLVFTGHNLVPVPPPGFDGLSTEEKIEYVQALWDHIAADVDKVPLTDWQRRLLDERLDDLEKDPQGGIPWEDVRARIPETWRRRS